MPDRRTLIVLGSLVVGMTLTSGLLLVLEPGPVAPLSGVSLQSIDRSQRQDPAADLFDLDAEADERPWDGIIIHHSGAAEGSAHTLSERHRDAGRTSLGYHLVINNGSYRRDGLIEMGPRWHGQAPGAYVTGEGSEQVNRRYIGISLIGDGAEGGFTRTQIQELVWLVQRLQRRYDIPRDGVIVDIAPGDQPAETFPHTRFRQQLLSPGPAISARR